MIDSSTLNALLTKQIPSSDGLTIISAYITIPAIQWLKGLVNAQQVTIVGRLSPADLRSGASDIAALRAILQHGWQLKILPNLHAKIYLLDRQTLFVGSANLTANGLKLTRGGNIEAIQQKQVNEQDLEFVDHIVAAGVSVSLDMLDKMEQWLKDIPTKSSKTESSDWPSDILPLASALFVSDFPLAPPGSDCDDYDENPHLPFAQIHQQCAANRNLAESKLRNCQAFHWLVATLEQSEGRELYFGALTAALHDALADDPAPYRRDVKGLLSNLLQYLECFQIAQISLTRPKHSQLVKLL